MSELIDKQALPEKKFPDAECNGFGEGPAYRQGWNDAIDAIVDNEPTVDAIPIGEEVWMDRLNIRTRGWRDADGNLMKVSFVITRKEAEDATD